MKELFATGIEHEFRVRCQNKIIKPNNDFEKTVLELNDNNPSFIFISASLLANILNEIYEKMLFENILNKKMKISKLKKAELHKFYSYIALNNLSKKSLSSKITKLIKNKEEFNYIFNKNYLLYHFPLLQLKINIIHNDYGDSDKKYEKINKILKEKYDLLKETKNKAKVLAFKKHKELTNLQRRLLQILNRPKKISLYSYHISYIRISYFTVYNDPNAKNMLKKIKTEIKQQIDNTILSYSFINDTNIDKKDFAVLSKMLLGKDKIPEVDYSDKTGSLEYKTLRYKNLPFNKGLEDLISYETVSLKTLERHVAIKNLIENYGDLTYHRTGSLGKTVEIKNYKLNKNGELYWGVSEVPIDYSGSYHLWMTIPYTTKTTTNNFVEGHIFMGNLLQMLEPLLLANYGSPPVEAIGNNQEHVRSSLRQFINVYGGIGTSDLTLMRGSKVRPITNIYLRKSDVLKNKSINITTFNLGESQSLYTPQNKLIKFYNALSERTGTSKNMLPFPVYSKFSNKAYNVKNYLEIVLEKSKIDFFKHTRKDLVIGADIRTGEWSKNYEKPLQKDIKPVNILEGKRIKKYYFDTKNKKILDKPKVDNAKYKQFLKNRMGFEFRILDHLPTYRLDEIFPIISLFMVHSSLNFTKLSGNEMVINKQVYHNTVADVIINGYETNFSGNYVKYIEKVLNIKLEKRRYKSDELLNEMKLKLMNKYEDNKLTNMVYNFKKALPIYSFSRRVWMDNLRQMLDKSPYLNSQFNKLNLQMTNKEMLKILGQNWKYDIQKVRDYLEQQI